MKRFVMPCFAIIAWPACAQSPVTDELGTWRTTHSPQAGITLTMPCKPDLSYSDPQDGYGHASEQVELRCRIPTSQETEAIFRIDRTTYKTIPGNVQTIFNKYMNYIKSTESGTDKEPRVVIAGQVVENHQNFVLKRNGIHGDLGFHETGEQCFWNFYGLAGDSIIQALMFVPKSMCSNRDPSNLTVDAARFYNSIEVDGV